MTTVSRIDEFDGTFVRDGTPDKDRATESLEIELRELSERIAADPLRFQQVCDELQRRHDLRDEQPTPVELTLDQQIQKERDALFESNHLLTLKVTEMEGEQAELVIEAEAAKAAQREAEERLALLARRLPKKRTPMSRESATKLIQNKAGISSIPGDWMIDAVVEASR